MAVHTMKDYTAVSPAAVSDPTGGSTASQEANNSPYPPGNIGFGSYPADLTSEFPGAVTAGYTAVPQVPYKFTNPQDFAKKYAAFNRNQLQKNLGLSNEIGLQQVDTELQGLEHFAPAASALKRSEISLDNQFNLLQRTRALDAAMPGARKTLADQASRASAYASGRMPSDLEDRSYELGVRSRAADASIAGGFGAGSAASLKTSALMSAEQRLGLAQYGEQLTDTNLDRTAQLTLPATEYSTAGSEIKVMPEVGAGRAAAQARGELENYTMMNPATALQSTVQQRQFDAQFKQGVLEYNASNELQLSEFNATAANNFALSKFQYKVAEAGAIAGAAQTNTNTEVGIAQQNAALQTFNDYAEQAQSAAETSAIAQGINTIAGIVGGAYLGGTTDAATSALLGGSTTGTVAKLATADDLSGSSGVSLAAEEHAAGTAVPSATVFKDSSAVPQGYIPITSSANGTVAALPAATYQANADALYADTGISIDPSGGNQAAVTKALLSAGMTMNNAGVSYAPAEGQQSIGVNFSGQPLYASAALMQSTNGAAGASVVLGLGKGLAPLGVITDADQGELDTLSRTVSSDRMRDRLDTLAADGDGKGFVSAALSATGVGSASQNQPQAYAAHQLYQAWNRLSPAQKSLSLASLAAQGVQSRIGSRAVPSTEGTAYKSITVNDAARLISKGVNAYTLADDWETLNDLHYLQSGRAGTPDEVAATAQELGALGSGPQSKAVATASQRSLASDGWYATPSLGVGAIAARPGARIPSGYTRVATPQNSRLVVAIPAATASTAVTLQEGGLTGTRAGAGGVSAGARRIFTNWPAAGAPSRGLVGGSSVVAGIAKLPLRQQAELAAASWSRNGQ